MRNNLLVLMAQKAQREQRRITLRDVAKQATYVSGPHRGDGLSYSTVRQFAHDELKEYPKDMLEALCAYFRCDIGDLLTLVEVSEP